MAIEKTLFTAESYKGRAEEIYNYINTINDEFNIFSGITPEYSVDNNNASVITCTITNGGSIIIYTHSSNANRGYQKTCDINLNNGSTYSTGGSYNVSLAYYYGIKTSNGFYLGGSSATGYRGDFALSKNTDGTTTISFKTNDNYYIICPEKNLVYTPTITSANLSVFSPIPFDTTYSESMLFTPFSEYKDTVCTLTDSDGNKYFYDGYCALKE